MTQSDKSGDAAKQGEVLPPKGAATNSSDDKLVYNEIVALINQYTDRPDLFLEAIERHDPGFIKRMNAESSTFSKKNRDARFKFGQIQAYFSMIVAGAAAFAMLLGVLYLIHKDQAGFWSIVGLAAFYAVSQGGARGFLSIIDGIKSLISGNKAPKD